MKRRIVLLVPPKADHLAWILLSGQRLRLHSCAQISLQAGRGAALAILKY